MRIKQEKIVEQLDGQLGIWDMLKNIDMKKAAEEAADLEEFSTNNKTLQVENKNNSGFYSPEQEKFLNDNKVLQDENLSRIIKYSWGGIGIEYSTQQRYCTKIINVQGKEEHKINKKSQVLPMDHVLLYRKEFKANDIQEKRLTDISYPGMKIVRRKGDENIILIIKDKIISINHLGWALEFKNVKCQYTDDEISNMENENEETVTEKLNDVIKVGDYVKVPWRGETHNGIVTRVYNGGDTINCSFNGMHSAFYKGLVQRIVA